MCIDEKFSKPVVLYKRKYAFNKLIEAIFNEYDYCKKHFNKNLVMTAEDEKDFRSSNKCCIGGGLFAEGDNKVRDNDHVTG